MRRKCFTTSVQQVAAQRHVPVRIDHRNRFGRPVNRFARIRNAWASHKPRVLTSFMNLVRKSWSIIGSSALNFELSMELETFLNVIEVSPNSQRYKSSLYSGDGGTDNSWGGQTPDQVAWLPKTLTGESPYVFQGRSAFENAQSDLDNGCSWYIRRHFHSNRFCWGNSFTSSWC